MSHVTSPESRIGNVCKTKSDCTNNSMTCAAACILSLETMAAGILDAASQIGTSSLHQDGRISVWRHQGECTLAMCIHHCHNGTALVGLEQSEYDQ
ncbi:hypothetical protein TNCV_1845311 [Trichonephila clavipes]|nr:hypothetical protein TNCV_1845311 [Trichonephila clavipes]